MDVERHESVEWPPRLTIETEPILRLFPGENFYSSQDAAIREVILNSIDAIGRRRNFEPTIEQRIDVVFDRDKLTVTVTDNGDGMSRNDLSNLFSKAGASASRIRRAGKDYRPIGEFGIGTLSYFLVCAKYEIQTKKGESEPVGLVFREEMLDGKTYAEQIDPTRIEVGTTIAMFFKSPALFDLTVDKFSYWMRNVSGLSARVQPDGFELKQGGLSRQVRGVELPPRPNWIESAILGPPQDLDVWDHYDGKGRVDVLYRGVFVERVEIDQLWGLEGAVHVDPKHFRPKLNREGFVGTSLKDEISPFLRSVHPASLEKAVECVRDLLSGRDHWTLTKAITLWLAVPRSSSYTAAARVWDDEFRNHKTFRQLTNDADKDVSISDLKAQQADKVYLAPDQVNAADPVIGQAIRVLRATRAVIVQGIQRDTGYLSTVSPNSQYTSWLLLHTFRSELPPIVEISTVAQEIVRQESVADVFTIAPAVKLVHLDSGSAKFVVVGNEVWINIDTAEGRSIIKEICDRNEGHLGLWVACMMHAPEQGLDQVGGLLRRLRPAMQRLGLVRRQFLRSFLQ